MKHPFGICLILVLVGCGDCDSNNANNLNNANNQDDVGADVADTTDTRADISEDLGGDLPNDVSTDTGGDMATDMGTPESCANATPLANDRATGTIDAPNVRRFFTATVTAGEWYLLSTGSVAFDPVLFVRDDAGQQLAFSDDLVQGVTDASVYFRAPTTGEICLEVAEKGDFLGENAAGDPTFEFAVLVAPLMDDGTGLNIDTEPNDGPQTAQPSEIFAPNLSDSSALFLGNFEAAQSRDMYQLTPTTLGNRLDLEFLRQGIDGHGSSDELGVVNVYGGDIGTLIASFDGANAPAFISVPIPESNGLPVTLFIDVIAPDAIGANAYYGLNGSFTPDSNQVEVNEAGNDASANAEIATPNPGVFTSHYIRGDIPEGDVDHWSFQVNTGDTVRLFCSARRNGIGVQDVDFAILDGNATLVQNEIETETADVSWSVGGSLPPVTANNDGVHYVRITAGTNIPNMVSRAYRCGIFVD